MHNTLLVDHPEKFVLIAPWRFHPTPFWCVLFVFCWWAQARRLCARGGGGGGGGGLCAGLQAGCRHITLPPLPRPRRSPSNRNLEAVGRGALRFCAQPSLGGILPLAAQALRG